MIIIAVILVVALVVSVGARITVALDTPERRVRDAAEFLRQRRMQFSPAPIFVSPFGERVVAFDLADQGLYLVGGERVTTLKQQQLRRVSVRANGHVIALVSASERRVDRAAIERILNAGLTELRVSIHYRGVLDDELFTLALADPEALKTGATTASAAVDQAVESYLLIAERVQQGALQAQRDLERVRDEIEQARRFKALPALLELED